MSHLVEHVAVDGAELRHDLVRRHLVRVRLRLRLRLWLRLRLRLRLRVKVSVRVGVRVRVRVRVRHDLVRRHREVEGQALGEPGGE